MKVAIRAPNSMMEAKPMSLMTFVSAPRDSCPKRNETRIRIAVKNTSV